MAQKRQRSNGGEITPATADGGQPVESGTAPIGNGGDNTGLTGPPGLGIPADAQLDFQPWGLPARIEPLNVGLISAQHTINGAEKEVKSWLDSWLKTVAQNIVAIDQHIIQTIAEPIITALATWQSVVDEIHQHFVNMWSIVHEQLAPVGFSPWERSPGVFGIPETGTTPPDTVKQAANISGVSTRTESISDNPTLPILRMSEGGSNTGVATQGQQPPGDSRCPGYNGPAPHTPEGYTPTLGYWVLFNSLPPGHYPGITAGDSGPIDLGQGPCYRHIVGTDATGYCLYQYCFSPVTQPGGGAPGGGVGGGGGGGGTGGGGTGTCPNCGCTVTVAPVVQPTVNVTVQEPAETEPTPPALEPIPVGMDQPEAFLSGDWDEDFVTKIDAWTGGGYTFVKDSNTPQDADSDYLPLDDGWD